MTLIKSLVLVLTIVIVSSCATKKNTEEATNETSKIENTMESKKMIEAGFVKGTVNVSRTESCPYTIKVETLDYLLDPINLEKAYMNEGEKIWIKFSGLRMKNRCASANPVNVVEIQKRAE
jgi:hypothetical protein